MRWKGCSSEEDSWKPYRDLPFAQGLIKQFLASFHKGNTNNKTSGTGKSLVNSVIKGSKVTKNGPKSPQAASSKLTAAGAKNTTVTTTNKMDARPIRQPPVTMVTRRQRGVPTKVADMAKKVLQRSTRTLQKVSNLNNMPVNNSSQRRTTLAGASSPPAAASSRSQNNKPQKKIQPKTKTVATKAKPGTKVVTRVRSSVKGFKSIKITFTKSPAATATSSAPSSSSQSKSSNSKPSTKSSNTAKRSSLQITKTKKNSSAPHRTTKSLSPQSTSNKTKNKLPNNSRKRKLELADDADSSDDDDYLYSLACDTLPPKAKQAKVDNSNNELHKLLISPNSKSLLARKALKLELDARSVSRASSGRATPESDPEISFKQHQSPGRRLLLKDSMKSKPKAIQQGN